MGCDIHITVQTPDGDQWRTAKVARYGGRNYVLFAILAGVRNGSGYTPICEPRGFPPGFTVDDYDHTPSWLTVREILDYPHWDDPYDDERTLADTCGCFLKWVNDTLLPLGDDVRLVFWFDS